MKRNQKTRQLHAINALYLRTKRWYKPEQVSPRFRESDEELRQSDTNYSIRCGCLWTPKELGHSDILCKSATDFFTQRTPDGTPFHKIALDKDERDMRYSYIDCKNLGLVRRRRQEASQNVDDWKSQVDDWENLVALWNGEHDKVDESECDLDDSDDLYCYADHQSIGFDDYDTHQHNPMCIDSVWDELEGGQSLIDDYWMSDPSTHLFPNNEWRPAPTSIPDSPFADKF